MSMLVKVKDILENAGNRESFFREVSYLYTPSSHAYRMIEKAYNDAKDAFRLVYRDSGERYFEHIRAVALIELRYVGKVSWVIIVVALLHDILEDIKSWTAARIEAEYGRKVLRMLEYLSMPDMPWLSKAERLEIYHNRLQNAPRKVKEVKISDRLHNVLKLHSCEIEKIERKIRETEEVYLPLAWENHIMYHELLEAVAECKIELAEKKRLNEITAMTDEHQHEIDAHNDERSKKRVLRKKTSVKSKAKARPKAKPKTKSMPFSKNGSKKKSQPIRRSSTLVKLYPPR